MSPLHIIFIFVHAYAVTWLIEATYVAFKQKRWRDVNLNSAFICLVSMGGYIFIDNYNKLHEPCG